MIENLTGRQSSVFEDTRVPDARSRHRLTLPDAVLALAGLCLLPACLILPWAADLGLHLATVGRLEQNLWHPGNPIVDQSGGSPYYTPYTVALAVIGKLIGASAMTMLKVAAVANLVLLLTGMRAFVRKLTGAAWAPVLAFLCLMVLWGIRPLGFSGFFSVESLVLCIAYPSAFALGLTLHVWSLTARSTRRHESGLGWWSHVLIGALVAIVLISHQFTSIGTVAGLACLLVSRWRAFDRALLLRWAVTAGVGCGIVVLWPYYHLWALASDVDALSAVHAALYSWKFYALAIVAVPALLRRLRRDRLDPLVLLAACAGLIVAYGWVVGDYSWGRALPMLMLPLQIALGIELAENLRRPALARLRATPARAVYAAVAAFALLAGAWTQLGVARLYTTRAQVGHWTHVAGLPIHTIATLGRYDWMLPEVKARQVVLTNDERGLYMIAAYGAYSVDEIWYDPELSSADQRARSAAVNAFFRPGEQLSEARRILRRYGVSWIIATPHDAVPAGVARFVCHGPDGLRLLRVDGAA